MKMIIITINNINIIIIIHVHAIIADNAARPLL